MEPFTLYLARMLWEMSKRMHNFLFTHPRGVSPVWSWANNGQFALSGTSSVSLTSRVCSSRVVVVHLAHLVHTIIQRGVPSVGAMRKSQFQWSTGEHRVCWFLMMYEGTPTATWWSTSYGSSFHQSFTFLLPLYVSALARPSHLVPVKQH